jgi:excisionase family DNA binding protein
MSLPDRIERIGRALTADELAGMLTVSRITIFKQAKAGRIPSFRIGTCVRFDPKMVAQWLREMWSERRFFAEIRDSPQNADASLFSAGFSEHNPLSINNFIRQGGPFIVTTLWPAPMFAQASALQAMVHEEDSGTSSHARYGPVPAITASLTAARRKFWSIAKKRKWDLFHISAVLLRGKTTMSRV